MAYCGPRGIPLSEFLKWDRSDQDAALAWQAHESARCQDCSTHPDEWNERLGGTRWAYHAEWYTCQGCVERQRMEQNPELQNAPRGVHIRLSHGPTGECPRCLPLLNTRRG